MGERAAPAIIGRYSLADDDGRCVIASICGELRFPGCGPLLAGGMRGENPLLRRVSVIAAGRCGAHELIGEIVPLLDDGDQEVREGAVEALSRLAALDCEGVQPVAAALLVSADAEKRRNAARLFAALGDGDRLSILIKDEDATVRRNAVYALSSLKRGAGADNLHMALVDEDADVRAAVAEALGESGGEEAVAPLLLVLKDDDPSVRCAALKSLGRLGYGEARRAILEFLDDETDGLLVITALETLARIGGEGVMDRVKESLESGDEEVVKSAMEILSGEGSDWMDEYRERLLSHPHWDVRRSFIGSMAAAMAEKAVPHLRAALESENDDLVRERILEILDRYQ
jgi:HEAT repeat protein